MSDEQAVAELREKVYCEVLELYEGDSATAEPWLASPIRSLGNTSAGHADGY